MGAKITLSGGIKASKPATVATMLATPEMNSQTALSWTISLASRTTSSQSDVASCQRLANRPGGWGAMLPASSMLASGALYRSKVLGVDFVGSGGDARQSGGRLVDLRQLCALKAGRIRWLASGGQASRPKHRGELYLIRCGLLIKRPGIALQRSKRQRPVMQRRRSLAEGLGGPAGERQHINTHVGAEGVCGLAAPLLRTCRSQRPRRIGQRRRRPSCIGGESLIASRSPGHGSKPRFGYRSPISLTTRKLARQFTIQLIKC